MPGPSWWQYNFIDSIIPIFIRAALVYHIKLALHKKADFLGTIKKLANYLDTSKEGKRATDIIKLSLS